MNFFSKNDMKRESVISDRSNLSEESFSPRLSVLTNRSKSSVSKIENDERKDEISFSEKFLFFGPLILCSILLICGIIIFIIVEQRNNQNDKLVFNQFNLTSDDDYNPLSCRFDIGPKQLDSDYARNELKCGLNRSSIINLNFLDSKRLINPGENLDKKDLSNPPLIKFDYEFLSKVSSKSYILLLIDPELIPNVYPRIVLHWIRFVSSSFENEEDLCFYSIEPIGHKYISQKIFLLYATNYTYMMIKAKTFCNKLTDSFLLKDYIHFFKLKLIASTYFYLPQTN